MGVERAVTLWYLHRQMLLQELASLEAQLMQMRIASEHKAAQPQAGNETVGVSLAPTVPFPGEGLLEIEKRYKTVQQKLCSLGPCPRPMMG